MTTMTVDAHRERMLGDLSRGNAYGFLTMADVYLRACPDDAYVRLMTVREYLKLGLVAAARDALGDVGVSCAPTAELDALAASLASIAPAPLPWSDCRSVFDANLDALRGRGFNVGAIEAAWAERSTDFERFVDKNGATQVRRREADGTWLWVPALRNHASADEAQPLPRDATGRMPGPYLFDGLGQGGFFERVFRATHDSFLGFSCALFVVEPDPAALAMVLHLRDMQDILRHQRTLIFTGDNWEAELKTAWERDIDLPFPTQSIASGPRREEHSSRVVSAVESAIAAREREIASTRREVEHHYASRDLGWWARRFDAALSGRGDPIRILAAVSTHTTFLQYSMRDARRAFDALGHRCVLLSEDKCYQITSPLSFHQAVLDLDPDVFFIIDHLRAEFADVLPENLPILTWDQDQLPHVITRENIQRMAVHDFLVGCSKAPCVKLGADPRQIRSALVPTCPEQFGGDPLTDEERRRFTCDVSFVSHASQTPAEFHEEERRVYGDALLQQLLDVMFEMMPAMIAERHTPSGHVASLVLEEGMRRCGIRELTPPIESRIREWYLWRLGDRFFRHEALSWVAEWARRNSRVFRIYGNGWDKHPTLSQFAAGPARNGRELLCIYRASKINLQLMPAGFLHQRAMDGLAAGGFFLTRKAPRDLTGRTLRSLVTRTEELGISDSEALLRCQDETVRAGLSAVLGGWLERLTADGIDAWDYLRQMAEVPFPDELFPRFSEIVFDSPARFGEVADRFIDNASTREVITNEMRDVVVRELSYKPTMQRFLEWMRDYLREQAQE